MAMHNPKAKPQLFDASAIQSLAFLTEGGGYRQPADSGMGPLYRPFARGETGAAVASLETLYDFWINYVPDPDEALKMDPRIRTKIRMHPDVAAAMRKRELTVASFPDSIEPNPNSKNPKEAKELAKYVDEVWQSIPSRKKLYQGMQQAVMDGGIGIEFMWHREASGIERPARWHTVHKSRFVFDRLHNLSLRTRNQPVWGAYVAADPETAVQSYPSSKLPMGKFLYHMHRQEPGTWEQPDLEGYQYYGVGEDIPLYYVVNYDTFALRMRMKLLEKYGMPPVDIYYPDNYPATGNNLRRIADSVRDESITTIPHTVGQPFDNLFKIVAREFPKLSYDAFENFTEKWTAPRIDKILLGSGDESKKTEGGKGGYSDHVSRSDSGPQVWFTWDAGNISETITNQLIPAIVWQRFPNCPLDEMPIHKLQPKEERDRQQEVQIIEGASKLVPLAESEVYERLGFRRPQPGENGEPGEATVGGPQPPGDDGMGLGGMLPPPMAHPRPGGPPKVPSAPAMKKPIGATGGQGANANRGITMPRDGSV